MQLLLGIDEPDYRMRDVELLARSLAFRFAITEYGGRMKPFLDDQFSAFNQEWLNGVETENQPDASDVPPSAMKDRFDEAMQDFDVALEALARVFGQQRVARKPASRSFNRAIFDALIFVAVQPGVAGKMIESADQLEPAYEALFEDDAFRKSVELDTASTGSTVHRIAEWGRVVADAIGQSVEIPVLMREGGRSSIKIEPTGKA